MEEIVLMETEDKLILRLLIIFFQQLMMVVVYLVLILSHSLLIRNKNGNGMKTIKDSLVVLIKQMMLLTLQMDLMID